MAAGLEIQLMLFLLIRFEKYGNLEKIVSLSTSKIQPKQLQTIAMT